MGMTVSEMKQDAVRLIYQVDDQNAEKMEKILLFLKASIVKDEREDELARKKSERMSRVRKYAGAFSGCEEMDYKAVKELCLSDKHK